MKRGLAGIIYLSYICTRNTVKGSLAQLVQSVCLTSRGSGVRIPQLPQWKPSPNRMVFYAGEHSSVGLERLLDKQEVSGSNPLVPTRRKAFRIRSGRLFRCHWRNADPQKGRIRTYPSFCMNPPSAVCRAPGCGVCRGRLSPARYRGPCCPGGCKWRCSQVSERSRASSWYRRGTGRQAGPSRFFSAGRGMSGFMVIREFLPG